MKVIYEALAAGSYPNSRSLGVELETSPQTAKRDIDFMRDRWRLPIAYDARQHGYYFSRPVEPFPGSPVTHSEVFALMLAHKALKPYGGTAVQASLEQSVERWSRRLEPAERMNLETCSRGVSFRARVSDQSDSRAFGEVTRAIVQHRALSFAYRKPGERMTRQRHVYPYHLVGFEHRWYLLAYDVERGEIRKFALNRMRNARLLESETFSRPAKFDPEEYFAASFGLMTGRADYEVTMEMDAWLTDVLRGSCWHCSQVWTELPGGGSRLQLRVNCLEEITHWVMSWSSHVTVLAPQALVARVATAARGLLARHPQAEPDETVASSG